jgi:two-component system nitrate/nitrite response regulator NarL
MLTDRQQQVVTFACEGLPNKAIARKLGITEGTVKIHLHAIFKKLNVHSRIELFTALADRRRSAA